MGSDETLNSVISSPRLMALGAAILFFDGAWPLVPAAGSWQTPLLVVMAALLLFTLIVVALLGRKVFVRSAPGTALVVYGRIPGGESCLVVDGARVVMPVVNASRVLSLGPVTASVAIQGVQGRDRAPMSLRFRVKAEVGKGQDLRVRAAERLLEVDDRTRDRLLGDVARGEATLLLGMLTAQELRQEREDLQANLTERLDNALAAFGLVTREVRLD